MINFKFGHLLLRLYIQQKMKYSDTKYSSGQTRVDLAEQDVRRTSLPPKPVDFYQHAKKRQTPHELAMIAKCMRQYGNKDDTDMMNLLLRS